MPKPHRMPMRSVTASAPVHHLPGGPSDDELVGRILAGDRWAEEAFYRRNVALVAATALRLLRNRAEMEDVVQETFLLAFQRLHQLRSSDSVRAWLVRIAVSRVYRRFRWHKVRKLFGVSPRHEEGLEDAASDEASSEDRTELMLIDRALEHVKAEQRTAWLLRHAVGCSLEEVATACGCSLAAAKRRIRAADEYLDAHIQGGGGDAAV